MERSAPFGERNSDTVGGGGFRNGIRFRSQAFVVADGEAVD